MEINLSNIANRANKIEKFNTYIFEDMKNYISENYMFELLGKKSINKVIIDLDYYLKHLMFKKIIFSYKLRVDEYIIVVTLINPAHKEFTENIKLL